MDPGLPAAMGMLSRRRSQHALDLHSLESFDQQWRWVDCTLRRIRNGITPNKIKNKLWSDERLSLKLYIQQLTDLQTSPKFEPSSPEALLARYRDITGRIYPALLNLFHMGSLPRQPLEITEIPRASASMALDAYCLAGSCDKQCPRLGVFYVNTLQLETRRTYKCKAMALHEAIPGHHIQGAIQAKCDLSKFRKHCGDQRYFKAPCRFPFYMGYIEEWGLYYETLGEELGVYTKPTDRFGQLPMETIRCCRLVADTGMSLHVLVVDLKAAGLLNHESDAL